MKAVHRAQLLQLNKALSPNESKSECVMFSFIFAVHARLIVWR
jgi:hypothetical protein